jgi:hypothetical protein
LSVTGPISSPTVTASSSLKVAGKEMGGHVHGNVSNGTGTTGAPA